METAHWVVPPILTAGAEPRRDCKLERQFSVPAISMYPGNAKNSIDTLRREGSTATAELGADDGIVNVVCATTGEIKLPTAARSK